MRSRTSLGRLVILGSSVATAACIAACSSSDDTTVVTGSPDATANEAGVGPNQGDASGSTGADASGDATTNDGDDASDGAVGVGDDASGGDDAAGGGTADGGSDGSVIDAGSDAAGGKDAAPDAAVDAGVTANVHFYGRFDNSAPYTSNAPYYDWSGTSMLATFTGTGVAVTLSSTETGAANPQGANTPDPNELEVVIDGNPQANALVLKAGTNTYQLTTGLSPAPATHTVQLYKRTEAEYGSVQFLGFQADTGDTAWAYKPTVDPYTRHIEVIGDSITCGYGTLSTTITCSGTTYNNEEDEYLAYGAVAARSLNAALSVVAYSGKGVYQNLDRTDPVTIPQMYPRSVEAEASSMYNFSSQPVDAVVINLGTNDFNPSKPDKTGFETAYENFITTIRGKYPTAYILLAAGPMITANNPYAGALADYEGYLTDIVTEKNDAKLSWVSVGQQDCSMEQCGCDSHPNVDRQASMAAIVTSTLKTALHW